MTHDLHKRWLLVTGIGIASFGPVFALGSVLATAEAARWSLDVLSWPVDGNMNYEAGTTRFLSALTGGFLFGWGVMVLLLRQWVFDAAPDAVRKAVLGGVSAWCVLDSCGSFASGNASNVLFNLLVLATLTGPLWFRAH
ncbi:MAG: hypothetical protein H2054_10900 [Sphingomonas sp.]|uniref:hypothetical protein n=1 Tax=Sphingomonas sp. TaxID=28214 RepID=UPI0017FA1BC3|nr:hypothetical protein [Zymomonas sp.]MBA4773596.1 hypothetical protein [Sphingomonas sp.]